MSYYHYTKGLHLPTIVNDGIIKTTNAGIEKREKPAAWLTKSPQWEICCNVGSFMNLDLETRRNISLNDLEIETVHNSFMMKKIGMCRIVISETLPTVSWAKFKHVSGISERMYETLDKLSQNKGSITDQWSCTFNPIPRRFWESIEMFVKDEWVKWDESLPIAEFVDLCMSCNGSEIYNKTRLTA